MQMIVHLNGLHLQWDASKVKVLNRYEEYKGVLVSLAVSVMDQNGALSPRGQSPYFQKDQLVGVTDFFLSTESPVTHSTLPKI